MNIFPRGAIFKLDLLPSLHWRFLLMLFAGTEDEMVSIMQNIIWLSNLWRNGFSALVFAFTEIKGWFIYETLLTQWQGGWVWKDLWRLSPPTPPAESPLGGFPGPRPESLWVHLRMEILPPHLCPFPLFLSPDNAGKKPGPIFSLSSLQIFMHKNEILP